MSICNRKGTEDEPHNTASAVMKGAFLVVLAFVCAQSFAFIQSHSRHLVQSAWLKPRVSLSAVLSNVPVDRERTITEAQVSLFKGESFHEIESIFRKYPFHDCELPQLADANNYYSGNYGGMIWHQNADQVMVFIPIKDESLTTSDVDVKISVTKVEIRIRNEQQYSFGLIDRVIPDGSFWTWETDKRTGQRFIQLDLEKRYRVINWKSLFPLSPEEIKIQQERAKSDLFQQFLAANKGIAKLTGKPSPAAEDLVRDLEFMDAINGVPEKESAVYRGIEDDGNEVEIDLGELDEPTVPYESIQDLVDEKRRQEGIDCIPVPPLNMNDEDGL